MNTMMNAAEIVTIAITRKNYDPAIFKESVIEAAELEYIKPILGADLYDEIRTQYRAETLTALNRTLVNDYLKKVLAYYTVYMCLPTMMVDISSVGMQLNSTEFSSPISSGLRAEVGQSIQSIAKAFTDKAVQYLEDNSTDYPLYNSGDNVENDTSIIGGIILDEE